MRRRRPLHKRLALHPVSVLLLLCVGVLLAGVTFHGFADSYTVTAEVPAPLPPGPAVITSPADQTHFTAEPVTVSGTCPQNTYVKLYRNSVFDGVATCGAGQTAFHIDTDLSLGSNVLLAQVFNITDEAGPASPPVTLFFDNPIMPPVPSPVPVSPPTTLQVLSEDRTVYNRNVIAKVSSTPTITGTAPPYSHIVLTFHSAPLTCATYADGNGNWSCTLAQPLPDGLHTVDITATMPSGEVLHTTLTIEVVSQRPLSSSQPFLIRSDFHYQVYKAGQSFGWNLSLSGGSPPYALTIDWGDSSESTIVRTDGSTFVAAHTYNPRSAGRTHYTVKIKAVDNKNASALLQSVAIVDSASAAATICGGAPGVAAADLTCNVASGVGPSLLTKARQWLWLLWPAYGIVALMVLSFWLGERQAYQTFFKPKRFRRRHP